MTAAPQDTCAMRKGGLRSRAATDLLVATNAHVACRRPIGPPLLGALTEAWEAASTKAATTASTPALPLQA